MVNQRDALERLNSEREYEEKISSDLLDYYLFSLDSVFDMTKEQKKKIKENLTIIAKDSQKHSSMIEVLIRLVLENGEIEY